MIRRHLFAVLLVCLTISTFIVSTEAQRPVGRIHYGDLVDIDVVGSLEYDWRGTLTPEGFLEGPDSIEEQIYALCRTEAEVAEAVKAEFAKFLRDPEVIVRILDRSKRPEAMLSGAVRTPHRFRILRTVKLNELLILSGGITDAASGEISIFRPAGASCSDTPTPGTDKVSQTINIKISDHLKGAAEANPDIASGDIVTVVPAWPIFVIGGVNSPTQLSLRTQTTVSRAVASAGGVAKEGIATDVTIFRRGDGRAEVIETSLSKIESGETADIELKPFDVVEVGQRGRPKRQFPPVIESNVTGVTSGMQLPLRVID